MQTPPILSTNALPRFPYKRFARDAGIATIINVTIGVCVTLVLGDWSRLYEQVVYSMCIGTVAFVIIDLARLKMWTGPGFPTRQLVPFLGVLLAAAPISNYAGVVLGSRILGYHPRILESLFTMRWTSNVMFTLLAICGATLLFINREHVSRVRAEAAQERARAEAVARQAVQAQLQLLQAQVEPHMLFNTLAQEFDLLDAYLGLMGVRMGERLRYRLHLPHELGDARVPPMLLQPLVENAIVHGLEPKIAGGEVVVTAVRDGDMLVLTVADTGLGLAAAGTSPGTGVGVANTRDRLRGLYGQRASLSLEPASTQGAVARLTLPLEKP